MKTPALWLSVLLVGASLAATGALAVDNVTSRDAPDLASVRAKIKAKDLQGRDRGAHARCSRPISTPMSTT